MTIVSQPFPSAKTDRYAALLESWAFGLLIFTLIWTPFPLGSNRPWSWSLLSLLITLCWLLFTASICLNTDASLGWMRRFRIPFAMALAALCFGFIQVLPWAPSAVAHPIWTMASSALGHQTASSISMNPWRSLTELVKLITYAQIAFLALWFAKNPSRAQRLLDVLIFSGAAYATYGLCLAFFHSSQFEVFYSVPDPGSVVSGPFVNRNSYATYMGLVALCAVARLVERSAHAVSNRQDWRRTILALLHFLFGRGTPLLFAAVLVLSTLIATGSLAGFLATLLALATMLVISGVFATGRQALGWTLFAAVLLVAGGMALFAVNGGEIQSRLNTIAASGMNEETRVMLWNSAQRMIGSSPYFGLGLGTFENAYPLYADSMLPFTMDKAHNDYLELAAGWGLPAALAWWAALAWVVILCARGYIVRHRNRIFPLLGVGASVLVGAHEAVDFSLQIPAIAATYAAILGLGLGQTFRTNENTEASVANATRRRVEIARMSLAIPALIVGALSIPRLVSGIALETAFPASVYVTMNVALPHDTYVATAEALARADQDDGETKISRGEAELHAHPGSRDQAATVLADGLARSPMSARGWTLLAIALGREHPRQAASALSMAFELAPYDFWLIGLREQAGAPIVNYLSPETRSALIQETRLLWNDPQFVPLIYPLFLQGGGKLFALAFADQPNELKAINRRVARQLLGLAP
jgi:O-antigen ligase